MFNQTWGRAGIVLGIGVILFAAALWKSFNPPEEDTRDLAASIAKLRQSTADAETSLKTLRSQNEQLSRDLLLTKTTNTQSAASIEKRREQVRMLEQDSLKRISNLRSEAQKLEAETQKNALNKETILVERENQKIFQTALLNSTGAVATIASAHGDVASGCLIAHPNRPMIFTVLPPQTPTDGLFVKLTLEDPNTKASRQFLYKAMPVHYDQATALTVLTFNPQGSLRLKAFLPELLVDGKQGEKVYMIGTQLVGNKVLENNIYEGTISALNRSIDNTNYLQVAMPGNFGMKGAPLFNTQRELVGILKGSLEGLERTSIAIPAKDVMRIYQIVK